MAACDSGIRVAICICRIAAAVLKYGYCVVLTKRVAFEAR